MSNFDQKEKNYYEILGVPKEATQAEIKKSYKALLLKYHPDVSKDEESTAFFMQVTKAYSVLKDDNLRTEYNESLQDKKKVSKGKKFQYSHHNFFRLKDGFINVFKILFKNISGKKTTELKGNDFFSWGGELQSEILNMSAKELEDRLLYSDNSYVKANAAVALGVKEEKSTYSSLEKLLSDPNKDVKKSVIWALGNLKMKKSLSLIKIPYESSEIDVKIEILKAIYKIEEGKGIFFYKMLSEAINSSNLDLKKEALRLLLNTDKKLLYDDIKNIFSTKNDEIKLLLDKLVAENKIINYPGRI